MKKFAQMINGDIIDITPSDLKGCTFIADYLFMNKPIINSIQLPNTVKTIGNSAFYNNSIISSIFIPDSVEYIGESAFYFCTGILNPITINNAVIEKNAFESCRGIPAMTFGKNVKIIPQGCCRDGLGSMAMTDVYFLHSNSDTISFPAAGSSTGAFYVKTAKTMNIHTDNETVKNYAWASDNITPTFYHLDGSAW